MVSRRHCPRGIAREVFSDLLKSVSSDEAQAFKLVTDNEQGTQELTRFLEHFQAPGSDKNAPATFQWAHEQISVEQFLEKLSHAAKVEPNDPKLEQLLQNFDIEIIDTASAESEVDYLLSLMLAPDQKVENKREEITSRMLKAASRGQMLSDSDFMSMIGPDAKLRLHHTRNLPGIIEIKLQSDLMVLGYDPTKQARIEPHIPADPVTVLSGESGQGKTWSLSQAQT